MYLIDYSTKEFNAGHQTFQKKARLDQFKMVKCDEEVEEYHDSFIFVYVKMAYHNCILQHFCTKKKVKSETCLTGSLFLIFLVF